MPNDQAAQWAVCEGNDLLIAGHLNEAAACFQRAIQLDPTVPGAFLGLGKVRCGLALWQSARLQLEQALEIPADRQPARHALWEVCQVLGDREAAIAHLREAVRVDPLEVRPSESALRRVLSLKAVGDFQANLPLAPLLDPAGTELITLWLDPDLDEPVVPADLPPFDCLFIAIAEDERHRRVLAAADAIAARLGGPVINNGAAIARLSRAGVVRLLRGLPHALVPEQQLLARGEMPASFPAIIRPHHAHAGDGLSKLEDAQALEVYLQAMPETEQFYTAPYIDYRSADGLWRKYRVIFVDGQPMPFHLAIHSHWAVWYYNSGMAEDAAKRAEEARFLEDMESVFPPGAMMALRELGRRVELDYFGLDCGLMPDGRLLVFEIETGMLVHDSDPADIYPYKKRCVPRIFRAVEKMIDQRIAAAGQVTARRSYAWM
jgi:tetratricopeptide (TPR) repeat protein